MSIKKYKRWRQKDPKLFIKTSFRTVPLDHTEYRGKKKGKAVVGKLKKTKKWATQSILEEK
jgi:DNA-binding HxlR family transcriptional regulator